MYAFHSLCGGKDQDATAAVIAARAKEKGIAEMGKKPDPRIHTTVDFEKNREAFHRVQDWQETGKKQYK